MASGLEVINASFIDFLTNVPLMIAAQASPQTLTTATITALTWPAPSVDTYTGWAAGTPTRYTPKVSGYYHIVGSASFAVNSTGSRSVSIRKNGVATDINQVTAVPSSAFNQSIQVVSTIFFNGSTDYFEVYVDQGSGGNLNTVVTLTSVTARWVHY